MIASSATRSWPICVPSSKCRITRPTVSPAWIGAFFLSSTISVLIKADWAPWATMWPIASLVISRTSSLAVIDLDRRYRRAFFHFDLIAVGAESIIQKRGSFAVADIARRLAHRDADQTQTVAFGRHRDTVHRLSRVAGLQAVHPLIGANQLVRVDQPEFVFRIGPDIVVIR